MSYEGWMRDVREDEEALCYALLDDDRSDEWDWLWEVEACYDTLDDWEYGSCDCCAEPPYTYEEAEHDGLQEYHAWVLDVALYPLTQVIA